MYIVQLQDDANLHEDLQNMVRELREKAHEANDAIRVQRGSVARSLCSPQRER